MSSGLLGQKLCAIQPLTEKRAEEFGFDPWGFENGVVLVFENGVHLVASRDPEGNGPGCMFGLDTVKDEQFILIMAGRIFETVFVRCINRRKGNHEQ